MTIPDIPFKVAKLLKKNGFPQEYNEYSAKVYNEKDYVQEYETQRMVLATTSISAGTLCNYPLNVPEPKCYCPSYEEVLEWFREIHNIYIVVEPHSFVQDKAVSYEANYWFKGHYYEPYATKDHPLEGKVWVKFKDAMDAIINYCLTTLIN